MHGDGQFSQRWSHLVIVMLRKIIVIVMQVTLNQVSLWLLDKLLEYIW